MGVFAFAVVAIAVALATYLFTNYLKNRRFWRLINKFPGAKTRPFVGNAHQFGKNSEELYINVIKMHEECGGSTFKIIMGRDAFVSLCDPETIETLLSSNQELTKLQDYEFLRDWLGDGLLLATDNKWRKQRKIITPTFHFKILEQFVDVFNEKGEIFVKKLASRTGKVFDVNPLVTLYALDVICETAMGVSINAQENATSEYVTAVYRICEIAMARGWAPLKRNNFLYSFTSDYREQVKLQNKLHKFTNDVIKSRKELLKEEIARRMNAEEVDLIADDAAIGKKKKIAFLDLLLLSKTAEGEALSDQVIREEVDTFMFEGHDTTSACISFAIYCLSNHPEVQAAAIEEQLEIMGNHPHKMASYNDLQNMKYLDLVIKETLRMYPSVPMYGRKLTNDMALPDGKIIPAGANVTVLLMLLGRNPKYFSDPNTFMPERFLPENLEYKHPFLNVGFSAGPRNCIGQKFAVLEIKSILSKILRSYELYSSGVDLRLAPEIILKSKTGMQIKLRQRVYK